MAEDIVNEKVKPKVGEIQREGLGIPKELDHKPVLYVASHRGFLETKYKSHVEKFIRFWKTGESGENDEKESACLDLTQTNPDEVVGVLEKIMLRESPNEGGKLLPGNVSQNEPLPAFITNVIYLPQLDDNGESLGPSFTFAITPSNYKAILPQLKDFLVQKGVLGEHHKPGEIES